MTSVHDLPSRLVEHLVTWVGAWPPSGDGVDVVDNPANARPGWDGTERVVTGVTDADGRGVVGVPPGTSSRLASGPWQVEALQAELPGALGRPELGVYRGSFRWSTQPTGLADVGAWVPHDHPAVPEWLWPFGGDVLVVLDDAGRYVAGVGLKKHDPASWEISVGTEEAARGRGLARRLVAQAARAVLAAGAVPTYLHAPDNIASARVAEAAGFPDHGWTVLGAFPREP